MKERQGTIRSTLEVGLFFRKQALEFLREYCWARKLHLTITPLHEGWLFSTYGIEIEGGESKLLQAKEDLKTLEK